MTTNALMADGFSFWAEPSEMEVDAGVSVMTGGGEGRSGDHIFLGIHTPHSSAHVLLTPDQVKMLVGWLTEDADAIADGAA